MHVSYVCMKGEVNDRYEPLPGLFELPGFIWRRLPRVAKVAIAAGALGAVALAIALKPVIERSKEERARADAARSAHIQKVELEKIRREQRPRFARGKPAGADLAARRQLVASAAASIRADASARAAAGEFKGPIMRVECEADPAKAGRYACLAVTSLIPATPRNPSGAVGHPYSTRIDFQTGHYAFCKISGIPLELAVRARPPVPVPRVCGG